MKIEINIVEVAIYIIVMLVMLYLFNTILKIYKKYLDYVFEKEFEHINNIRSLKIITELGNREIEIDKFKKYNSHDYESICIHFDSNIDDSKAINRMLFITRNEARQIVEFLKEELINEP